MTTQQIADLVIQGYYDTAAIVQTALFLMVLIPAVALVAYILWDLSRPTPPLLAPVQAERPAPRAEPGVQNLHGVRCHAQGHELEGRCLCHGEIWHSCPDRPERVGAR